MFGLRSNTKIADGRYPAGWPREATVVRRSTGSPTAKDSGTETAEAGAGAEIRAFPDPADSGDGPGLTERQRRVLEVIRDWLDRFGYPPSVREIGEAVGLTSTSSVAHQLRALERKGYL